MPGKIKVNFKMPPESAAEKLARRHAELRKKSGLPDPKHYKKMAAQKQKEIDNLRKEEIELNEQKHTLDSISKLPKNKKTTITFADGTKKKYDSVQQMGRGLRVYHKDGKNNYDGKPSDHIKLHKLQGATFKIHEEAEQLDEMPESSMKTRDVHAHLKKAGWSLKRTGGGHDVYAHPKSKEHIAVPRHKQLKAPLIRGIIKASKVTEDTELDEQLYKKGRFVSEPAKKPFKSATIVSPVKEAKDEREYDYEGNMTKSQLRTIMRNAEKIHDMIEDDENLPEWVQSKITLAKDYIVNAANYLESEMNEEVEYLEEKNEPTNPALWSKAKSLAKQKFDVYPSAYANGWAAKWYKSKGGGWKSVSESVNEAADDNAKSTLSRKAQIVRDAARKKDSPEKFQKDPELSSDIHKT